MKKQVVKKASPATPAKKEKGPKSVGARKVYKGESITKNPDESCTVFKRYSDGSTKTETIWPRNKKTGREIVDGSKPWMISTNPKGEKNTQYGCNQEKGTLIHYSDGKWSVQIDSGRVCVEIPIAKMTDALNQEGRSALRYWMFHVEAFHRNKDKTEAEEIFRFLADGLHELNPKPLEQIVAAIKAVAASQQRRMENDAVCLSISTTANRLNRVPCKGEVRNYHNLPRPVSSREPNGYRGADYQAQRWNQILKTVGFDWLPVGKRGMAKKG